MSVIVLTSAKGAPGVTTTAVGLALQWPRRVLLVEADASGSSAILAGYLRGTVRHDTGLIDLAMAQRDRQLAQSLPAAAMPLPGGRAVQFIPGLTNSAQAQSMSPVWPALAPLLGELNDRGTDVIIDAGRLSAAGSPLPLLRAADVVLLVTRTTLPAVAATRAAASVLAEDLEANGRGAATLELLLVGEGQPYTGKEISSVTGHRVLGSIAHDAPAAEVYSVGANPSRRFTSTSLVRSLTATVSTLTSRLADRVVQLPDSTKPNPWVRSRAGAQEGQS